MASDHSQFEAAAVDTGKPGRQPLTQAQRKRYQQQFLYATKQAASSNFDYSNDLFSQCVLGDKDNAVYWQTFLASLKKKYDDNKKGVRLASVRTATQRAAVKKCQIRKDWDGVFRHGLEVMLLNPWDTSTLMAMAAAGEAIGLDEVPLIFLSMAREAAPKDVELNRAAGRALRVRKQHEQAIACWRRVLESRPDDEEAQHQIKEIQTEQVIHKGGYEDAESSRDVKVKDKEEPNTGNAGPAVTVAARHDPTPESRLQRTIREDPSSSEPYLELAEVMSEKGDYDGAATLLTKAYEATGQSSEVLERLEDIQLRSLRQKLRELDAEIRSGSADAKLQRKEVRREFDLKSLERAKHLAGRYPNDLSYEFDLGVAYQRVGQHREAIEHYQKARSDPRRKGECLLRLGQCFHQIGQPRLAATNYDAALAEITGQKPDLLKEALYCSGELSLETKDLAKAERQLTELAGLDFAYKDVSALLDKINELRNTEGL